MIYDKIKIYVTARIAQILEKDAGAFEFFKKDGRTPNKNAMLTRLVVNYFDEFREKQNATYNYLEKTIGAKTRISDDALKILCYEISEELNKQNAAPDKEKFDKLVSLKPTKETQAIVDYIEEYELEGYSLSEYFRNMFASYAALPQDKREEILFKKQKETIEQAIKEGKKLFLSVDHTKKNALEVSPYALTVTKDEIHVYLLAFDGKSCIPLRLSRITSAVLLPQAVSFEDIHVSVFEKMLRYGPQFLYRPYEEEIKVELTEKGIQRFKKFYVHRPDPTSIDGNIYTFHCAQSQVVAYFERFGSEAYILSPYRAQKEVKNFFRRGYYSYKDRMDAECISKTKEE
jgi:hypothetical protein